MMKLVLRIRPRQGLRAHDNLAQTTHDRAVSYARVLSLTMVTVVAFSARTAHAGVAYSREFSVFVAQNTPLQYAASREFSAYISQEPGSAYTASREFSSLVGLFANVTWEPDRIDVAEGALTQIDYTLVDDATVTIEFRNAVANADGINEVVWQRTSAEVAGDHSILWDGHGSPSNPSDPDPPSLDGAYYFELNAEDLAGHQSTWERLRDTVPANPFSSTIVSGTEIDPWLNERVEIRYAVTPKGLWDGKIVESTNANSTIRTLKLAGSENTPEVAYWDGRNDNGGIYVGDFIVWVNGALGIPWNSIIVRNLAPQVGNIRANAFLIIPSYGQISTLQFTLTTDAYASVDIQDPNGNHFRGLIADEFMSAGEQTSEWDGRNDEGLMLSTEGDYTVIITAVDASTGATTTRLGVIVAYK